MERLPLCVDCDGTLVHTDLLFEAMLRLVKRKIWYALLYPLWMFRGKAHLKMEVAKRCKVAGDRLPYNREFIEYLRKERATGRLIALVTGTPEPFAASVAKHLDLFSEVHATTAECNLTHERKRDLLCARFGKGQYEYAANEAADIPVWKTAGAAIIVNAPARIARAVAKHTNVTKVFPRGAAGFKTYARALRVHQWLKNLLIFVPLAVSHQFTNPELLLSATVAFVCFSLCASAVYVINDLFDLDSDRLHPRKRFRPFAAGELSVPRGLQLAVLCLGAALAASVALPPAFLAALVLYIVATTMYSFALKNRAVVDVLLLAGLYTVRIIAGAAATMIFPSFWLLAFAMFIFLSLAVAKRYAELLVISAEGKTDVPGRGYYASDLPLLITIGVANGVIAVLVLALYVNSPEVGELYRFPQLLWLMPPLMLYWVSYVWLKTYRGQMHDDPIVFAATNRPSIVAGACIAALLGLATLYNG